MLPRSKDDSRRVSLSQEMHARKLPRLTAPAQIIQFVVLVEDAEIPAAIDAVAALIQPGASPAARDDRYMAGAIGSLFFAWERHHEFLTYSFVAAGDGTALFDLRAFAAVADWIAQTPGRTIRSSHIRLTADPALSDVAIEANFAAADLVVSDVAAGSARIWCDFRLHGDGFGRLLVLDRGLRGAEAGQLVQRLQEMGNYRKMALLGLPVAQAATPQLSRLGREIADTTIRIASPESEPEPLLDELSALSAELARITATSRYRMSATRAYAEICLDRIRRLSVSPVRGHVSFDDFTERRLLPAMRTCEAFSRRLDDLSQRAAWTSGLLRARVAVQ